MTKYLLLILCSGCVIDEVVDESTASSELVDFGRLATVPGPPTPAGYSHYCSVTDSTTGGWALGGDSTNLDPCRDLGAQVGPAAQIRRAGLFATAGNNQVMARCDGGMVTGIVWGADVIPWIKAQVANARNCTITIAPTRLPVWFAPFSTKPTGTFVFDYNHRNDPAWNVAEFGGTGTGSACSMDRTATETETLVGSTCMTSTYPKKFRAVEPAYDWDLPLDTPILAVADGVIRASYARDTDKMCGNGDQLELFLETQVGTGAYAEHFVAAYHHMNPNPDTSKLNIAQKVLEWGGKPMAPAGTYVKKGDVIAFNGSSGCSSSPHLDLSVFRLTNLTGARSYVFQALETHYLGNTPISGVTGVNGTQGVIDPFGWAGPSGVDPMAYKYIGYHDMNTPPTIVDGGAFSINLWGKVYAHNGQVLVDVFDFLPHAGGASY